MMRRLPLSTALQLFLAALVGSLAGCTNALASGYCPGLSKSPVHFPSLERILIAPENIEVDMEKETIKVKSSVVEIVMSRQMLARVDEGSHARLGGDGYRWEWLGGRQVQFLFREPLPAALDIRAGDRVSLLHRRTRPWFAFSIQVEDEKGPKYIHEAPGESVIKGFKVTQGTRTCKPREVIDPDYLPVSRIFSFPDSSFIELLEGETGAVSAGGHSYVIRLIKSRESERLFLDTPPRLEYELIRLGA